MNGLLKNTWVKMAGVLLFAVLMCASAFFTVCTLVLEGAGAYQYGEESLTETVMESIADHKATAIISDNIVYMYNDDYETRRGWRYCLSCRIEEHTRDPFFKFQGSRWQDCCFQITKREWSMPLLTIMTAVMQLQKYM